uniref:Uncharacterized protein n=1 Tax=Caenorhabditis tropicalis TaxID=1561998 RepID=A0A1I7SZ04_9PELO
MNFDCAAYEQYNELSAKHNRLCVEYDKIEPELVTIHKQMKSGEKIEKCEMAELRSALHVFLDTARVFISAESTAEREFRTNIGSVIDFLTLLKNTLNKIELAIDSYESGETTKPNDGI